MLRPTTSGRTSPDLAKKACSISSMAIARTGGGTAFTTPNQTRLRSTSCSLAQFDHFHLFKLADGHVGSTHDQQLMIA
jgi:hypothetical protein